MYMFSGLCTKTVSATFRPEKNKTPQRAIQGIGNLWAKNRKKGILGACHPLRAN
jgi:hypothetical protein